MCDNWWSGLLCFVELCLVIDCYLQDQQQKQLDLILAIAKATKLGEKKPENIKQQDPPSERVNSVKLQMEQHTQAGLDSVGPQVEDTALKLESLW